LIPRCFVTSSPGTPGAFFVSLCWRAPNRQQARELVKWSWRPFWGRRRFWKDLRALTHHSFICFRADQSAGEKERQDRVQGDQPWRNAANEYSYPSSASAHRPCRRRAAEQRYEVAGPVLALKIWVCSPSALAAFCTSRNAGSAVATLPRLIIKATRAAAGRHFLQEVLAGRQAFGPGRKHDLLTADSLMVLSRQRDWRPDDQMACCVHVNSRRPQPASSLRPSFHRVGFLHRHAV
jgi:hypothetical protein